jgi:protein phosphatase
VKIDCVAFTHNGLVRSNNEDSILCDGWMRNRPMDEPIEFSFAPDSSEVRVFALADGLGGHSSGEVASQFALSRLCSAVAGSAAVSKDSLDALIQDVHKSLFNISAADPIYRGMGATVAGLLVEPKGLVHLFHVGDSRIYRREDRFLQLLTKDDRLESDGYGEANLGSHSKSSLLQCLGGLREFSQIDPHVTWFEMSDVPETFLLCSDGVSDMISQDEMEESMSDSHQTTVRTIFERVRNAGAKDNVSIIIVEVSPGSRPHETPLIPPASTGLTGGQA